MAIDLDTLNFHTQTVSRVYESNNLEFNVFNAAYLKIYTKQIKKNHKI